MLPMLRTPRPLSLWRMRESLEDLWLIVDALVEPGGVRMMPLPRQTAGGPGDGQEPGERLLREVRQSLTVLLQVIDEELLRSEESMRRESWDRFPWPERQRRQETWDDLSRPRGHLVSDFTRSLTDLSRC